MNKEEASELWDNPAFHQGRIYGREEARVLSDLLDGMSVKEAKRYEQGRMAERERIIKLLEDEGSSTFSLAYLISLIKGENK